MRPARANAILSECAQRGIGCQLVEATEGRHRHVFHLSYLNNLEKNKRIGDSPPRDQVREVSFFHPMPRFKNLQEPLFPSLSTNGNSQVEEAGHCPQEIFWGNQPCGLQLLSFEMILLILLSCFDISNMCSCLVVS